MLESIPVGIIVGTVLGFLSGLGIGGGSLLMVWVTSVLSWGLAQARAVNLLFFIPSALLVTFIRLRQGKLNWKTILPAILSGCLFAVAGSLFSGRLNTESLKKLFGILLILAGIKELFYRERKDK